MSPELLSTKLFTPPVRKNLVPRPRLIERLNEGLEGKLTLITAPAGFGKTTLVSEWLADCVLPGAWLSLDEGDNDPTRFLTYLVAALQAIAADIGKGLLSILESPQPPPIESILIALLNEITAIPDNFVLVLDDYHAINSKPVDNVITFLLEHLPLQMHLVIATREDPHLPLARLCSQGQLTEMRAADLRFTPAEAAEQHGQRAISNRRRMRCGITNTSTPPRTSLGVVDFRKASSSRFSSPCRSSSYGGLSHSSLTDSSVREQLSQAALWHLSIRAAAFSAR
jgi:LuxR family maltose regulon positive regulatory protein